MGGLESITHDAYVACAVKGELNAPLLMLTEPFTCRPRHWVVGMCGAKFLRNVELSLINVEGIDARSTTGFGCLDHCKANGTEAPDGD